MGALYPVRMTECRLAAYARDSWRDEAAGPSRGERRPLGEATLRAGGHGSTPRWGISVRRRYGPAKGGGGGRGGRGDMGGGRQGSRLGESALLLLDRDPSANLKVAEGRLVGD